MPRWSFGVALVLALAWGAGAQEPAALRRLEDRRLGPEVRQLIARAALQRAARTRVAVRWDPASGCPREVTFSPPLPLAARAPDEVVAEVVRRLAPLFGWRGPPGLFVTGTEADGARRVITLEQRLEAMPVEGTELRLVIGRDPDARRLVLERVVGRVYRDLPLAVAPPRPLPPRDPPRLGELVIVDAGPRPVVTPRPRGVWRAAHELLEVRDGAQVHRTLRDDEGRELWSVPLVCGAGSVRGRVFERDPRGPSRMVAVPDLHVQADGRVVTTDAQGRFEGRSGSLSLGFVGPMERVVAQAGAYPAGATIVVDGGAGDPVQAELNVFHHLVQSRRFFATIPGAADAVSRRTVAVVGLSDLNAYAGQFSVEAHGQRFDHPVFFGAIKEDTAHDATVITHERAHSLLFALGLDYDEGGDAGAIHEGLSDYFTVARLGTPVIGGYALGALARRLDVLRVYPADYQQYENHENGRILSGALLGARQELGPEVDALVVAAVRRVGNGPSLCDLAQAVVDVDAGSAREATLRRHFVRHGLLQPVDAPDLPPAIRLEVRDAPVADPTSRPPSYSGSRTDPRVMVVSQATLAGLELHVTATDPEQRGVTLLLAGLEQAGFARIEQDAADAGASGAVVRFASPIPAGDYVLALTAQDAGGETRVSTVTLIVGADPWLQGVADRAVIHAAVGETKREPLASLLGLDAAVVERLTREPGIVRLIGARSLAADVVGQDLVLRPRPGEEGVHELSLQARANWIDPGSVVQVTVVVGDGPRIDVATRGAFLGSDEERSSRWMLVAPGQPITAQAGEALELRVDVSDSPAPGVRRSTRPPPLPLPGWSDEWFDGPDQEPDDETIRDRRADADPSDAPAAPPSVTAVGSPSSPEVTLVEAPPELAAVLLPRAAATRPITAEGKESDPGASAVGATLWLTPPRGGAGRYVVVLEGRAGERTARRRLEVLVLPAAKNRPPTIEAPSRVAPGTTFTARVVDPEGGPIKVQLEGESLGSVTGEGEARRVDVRAEGRYVLVAIDDQGARTVRPVEVVAAAAASNGRPPTTGLSEVIDPADRAGAPGR